MKSEAGTTWRQGRELSDGKGRLLPPFTQDNAPQAAQSIFILKTRLWIAAAISQKSCTTLGYYFMEQPGHPPLFTHISVSKKPLLNNNVKLGKLSTWHMTTVYEEEQREFISSQKKYVAVNVEF